MYSHFSGFNSAGATALLQQERRENAISSVQTAHILLEEYLYRRIWKWGPEDGRCSPCIEIGQWQERAAKIHLELPVTKDNNRCITFPDAEENPKAAILPPPTSCPEPATYFKSFMQSSKPDAAFSPPCGSGTHARDCPCTPSYNSLF